VLLGLVWRSRKREATREVRNEEKTNKNRKGGNRTKQSRTDQSRKGENTEKRMASLFSRQNQ
jgi:hypothetical protein